MAITKTIEEDKIEIVSEFRHLQIRTATVIKEDGVELSRSFHRRVIHSGTINESLVWSDTDVSSESVEAVTVNVKTKKPERKKKPNKKSE